MTLLAKKVALVTGGSQGLGEAHVRKLVEEGAKVIITDILVDNGEKLAKELGDNTTFVQLDVTDPSSWDEAIKHAEEAFGPINVLVNNAGIDIMKPFIEFTAADLQKLLDVNLFGNFHGMQKILPSMKKAGGGSIVNISSLEGLRGTAGNSIYNASKFAAIGLTKAVAQEYAEYNIRVNSVHPGAIQTPGVEADDIKDTVQNYIQNIPMKRIGKPEEVANLVVFLASDKSSYSTGAEFIVDGGIMAT
ncbi:MAG: glucose 1-dehydrogenase [Psychrobacter sp.]|nr:glucose 1-dehydrogenase [Psychrobacter sp.]